MIPDPTAEILAIKRKLSDACGNDIHRVFEEAREHQQLSGRKSVPTSIAPVMPVAPNQPLHRSGEVVVSEVLSQTSPPGER